MKKVALTAALVAIAGPVLAGNIAPMAADPAPMVEITKVIRKSSIIAPIAARRFDRRQPPCPETICVMSALRL